MRRNAIRQGVARKDRHLRYQIRHWVDRLCDVPAFIIGNGPSLNDHNLSLLDPFFSLGINRSFLAADPTILLWQDISLWQDCYHKLHNIQALKVARDIADPRHQYYNFYLKSGPYKFDRTKTHILHGRGSSGPLAAQLAVAMGCRPIILLGMDCRRDDRTGVSDFWGENKYWTSNTLPACQKGLEFIKQACPVEVINCGNSDLWPKQDLKEVLKTIDPKYSRNRKEYVSQILATTT